MTERTTLGLQIETCRHLEVNIDRERDRNPVNAYLNLSTINNGKIGMDWVIDIRGREAICSLTKKTCALYCRRLVMEYDFGERCPAFERVDKHYLVEGNERGHMFEVRRMFNR